MPIFGGPKEGGEGKRPEGGGNNDGGGGNPPEGRLGGGNNPRGGGNNPGGGGNKDGGCGSVPLNWGGGFNDGGGGNMFDWLLIVEDCWLDGNVEVELILLELPSFLLAYGSETIFFFWTLEKSAYWFIKSN